MTIFLFGLAALILATLAASAYRAMRRYETTRIDLVIIGIVCIVIALFCLYKIAVLL